jgi:cellulose synthase/poly-beta-1,6-N-acetylglucosamine synthase-like glycosyltransferase
MAILSFLGWTITIIFVGYACFPAFSLLLTVFCKRKSFVKAQSELSVACIITAYKDVDIALPLVESILKQKYGNYHVYLVADNCPVPDSLPQNSSLSILFPKPFLHSKVLSIKYAMDRFVCEPDAILVLDSDNLLHEDALLYLNNCLVAGQVAVQGQRTAKNLNTTVAALDALGELYYNTIQRDAPFLLRSSATIAGSGMIIKTEFYRNYIDRLFAEGKQFEIAEDKLLQLMLVQQGKQIAYCREALIFDEKVAHGSQVQRQRTRWIRSWFQHWRTSMQIALTGIGKLSWNIFYFGVMLSFPPMFILVIGLIGLSALEWLIDPVLSVLTLAGLAVFFLQFFVVLIVAPAPKSIWRAIPKIPLFVWNQLLAVFNIQASKKDFMVTTHSQNVSIDDVWSERKKDFPYLKKGRW